MTWFKENKFLAGLLCITLLLAALIVFFGSKASSSLEEIQAEISAKQSKLEKMKTLNPYPTIESAKEKEANLIAVLAQENEAREKLLAFLPETMEDVSGAIFSENLTATVAKVRALFPEEGSLPKGFSLGFEAYSNVPPKEGATGVLTYQLGAMEYLFGELAAAGVTEVQNLSRIKVPAESGDDWPDADGMMKGKKAKKKKPKKKSKKGKGRRVKSPFEDLPPVAHKLPFELVFKAREAAARNFLTQIANSKEYFFETRVARVYNPSPIPSAGKAAMADKPKMDDDFEGDFVIEGAEPKPEMMEKKSEQILNKVSGGDQLVIYLRADLLLFIAEQKFPELK